MIKDPDVVVAIAHGHLPELLADGDGPGTLIARHHLLLHRKAVCTDLDQRTLTGSYKHGATQRLYVEDGGLCKL